MSNDVIKNPRRNISFDTVEKPIPEYKRLGIQPREVNSTPTTEEIENPEFWLETPLEEAEDETEVVQDLTNIPIGHYFVMLNGKIISSASSKEEMETILESLLFDENSNTEELMKNIFLGRRLSSKIGVFLDV